MMPPQQPVITIVDVHKSYGEVSALCGVDLTVSAGEIISLLGPNGAGKTTLVSIIAGLRRADEGSVRICGVNVADRPEKAREFLGLAPQELGIVPVVTVRENLRFAGELHGLRRRALSTRVDEVAEQLLLVPLLDRMGRSLSGGEMRRLHTAMALLHRPPLLLLDEPTAAADVQTRRRILDLVRQAAADGAAVLYSTHYLNEIESLDSTVAILDRGHIIANDPPSKIIEAHGTTVIEAVFDGPAPDPASLGALEADRVGSRLVITDPDRDFTAGQVLSALDPGAVHRLRSIDVIRPSLETAFLSLTGRRYGTRGTAEKEA
ncbi:ABC transporter ATP-binding protein [Spirillospora sp. NPDC046719]